MVLPVLLPALAPASRALSLGNLPLAGAALTLVGDLRAAGILGWPEMQFALTEIVPRLVGRAHQDNGRAIEAMVSLARSRVPVDTGRLVNGITGAVEGEYYVMRARAARDEGSADYARFVEFGTQPGRRSRRVEYQALTGFYANPVTGFESGPGVPAPRTRKQYRGHPGTQAQPYFFNSAREVMEKHFMSIERLPAEIGRQLGF